MLRRIKNTYHFLLWILQVVRLQRHRHRDRPVIISYCGVTSSHDNLKAWNSDGRHLLQKKFERQLRYIKRHYEVIQLSELVRKIRNGQPLPPRTVALTFDYGYSNAYTNAFSILTSYSIPFAVSLVTQFVDSKELLWIDRLEYAISRSRNDSFQVKIGDTVFDEPLVTPERKARAYRRIKGICSEFDLKKREMLVQEVERQMEHSLGAEFSVPKDYRGLSSDQVKELSKLKVDIGSHTTHLLNLTRISGRDLRTEVLTSKQCIEKMIGGQCSFFVYPFEETGALSEGIIHFVEKCGYQFALTNTPGFITDDVNLYTMPRITVSDKSGFFTFAARLAGTGLKRR